MAYSDFTLESVVQTFQLEIIETVGLFSEIDPVPPSEHLMMGLAKKAPLATAIGTEKARSEMIVADVLVEFREHFEQRISLFSGIDFNVDVENGLTGVCDFLISLSPGQFYLKAPLIVLVQAKNHDLKLGLGHCVAEMVAAQRFNTERKNDIPWIYGASTTGVQWKFLKLQGKCLHIDMSLYSVERCDRILGILSSMVDQKV